MCRVHYTKLEAARSSAYPGSTQQHQLPTVHAPYPPAGSSLISKGNNFHSRYKEQPKLNPTILLEKCTLC